MRLLETMVGALQVGGALLFSPFIRSWYNRWGATPEEVQRELPGDELVPLPQMGYTRAITIQASAKSVWPWLVQIGQGRGGLYSYDDLENLVGCDIRSADHIVPELQDLSKGDLVRLGPQGYPCFSVASIDKEKSLILISADPQSGQPVQYKQPEGKGYSIATWQFFLHPQVDGGVRLLTRQRLVCSPDLWLVWRITEPVGFVMERKMLLGIRKRAEKSG